MNKDRILEISRKLGLSHIGSCISILGILEEIYAKKKPEDKVILDNGHASLANYVVLESLGGKNAEEMFHKHGVHANRDIENGIFASNGSLGHNLGISIGFAIANPDKTIHVVVSDGSMMEGSNWEALRIRQKLQLKNLKIYTNFNGFSALAPINGIDLMFKMEAFSLGENDIQYHFTENGLGENKVENNYTIL